MCLQAAKTDRPADEDPDDEDLCVVCWEKLREVILFNCMHMVRPGIPDPLLLILCQRLLCLPRNDCARSNNCLQELMR